MTNQEIDQRLKALTQAISQYAQTRIEQKVPKLEMEFELLNMCGIGVMAMLGEIAKRLPESDAKIDWTKIEESATAAVRDAATIASPTPKNT